MSRTKEYLEERKEKRLIEQMGNLGLLDFYQKMKSLNHDVDYIVGQETDHLRINLKSCPDDLLDMLKYLNFQVNENEKGVQLYSNVFEQGKFGYKFVDGEFKDIDIYFSSHKIRFNEILKTILNDWANETSFDITGKKYRNLIKERVNKQKAMREYYLECLNRAVPLVEKQFEEYGLEKLGFLGAKDLLVNLGDEEKVSLMRIKPDYAIQKKVDNKEEPEIEIFFESLTKKEILNSSRNSITVINMLADCAVLKNGKFIQNAKEVNPNFEESELTGGKKVDRCSIDKFLNKEIMQELKEFTVENNPLKNNDLSNKNNKLKF